MSGRDTIQLSRWTPARWGWVAFELVWLLGSIAGLLRWPESGLSFWGQSIGYPACLLVMEAWFFTHRNDRLDFDDDGLVFVRGRRETALAWSDLETFWLDWTREDNALRLVAGGRSYQVGLDRLTQDIPAARRLRERLEPLWQRKLAAMATDEVPPSKSFSERLQIGAIALLAPVCLALTQSADSSVGQRLLSGLLALGLGILTVALWRFGRAVAGPGTVRTWGRRITLEQVETITIQRPRIGGERWRLRGRRGSGVIAPCVDFPLVVEHILRSCPHAAIEYRIRTPRTDLEAVFLPVPAGGGGELGSTAHAVAVADRQRLLKLTGLGLFGAIVLILFAVAFAPLARNLDRSNAAWRHGAVAVQGHVVEGGPPWRVRYVVAGREFTPTLYHRAVPQPSLQAGQTVTLRYLPATPGYAMLDGQTMPNPFPVGVIYAICAFAAVLGAIGLASGARLVRASVSGN